MSEHSFTACLRQEVTAMRCSVLALYEKQDHTQYILIPQVEKEYMAKVGDVEEPVIEAEIEVEILEKKKEMVQAVLNRREVVDEAAIDAELGILRQQKLAEAGGVMNIEGDGPDLNKDQYNELHELYSTIVRLYHPKTHPDISDAHKLLFERANDAYRRRDLEALKLIYDMMISADSDQIEIEDLLAMLKSMLDTPDGETVELPDRAATDYTLAKQLCSSFVQTAEEAALRQELEKYEYESLDVSRSIERMYNRFPLTAMEMLADPAQVEAYKKELDRRMQNAKKRNEQLTREIQEMIERSKRYG